MNFKTCAAEVKQYFFHHHRDIEWNITDKELELFLKRKCITGCKDLAQIALLLVDYLVSQNMENDE